MTIHKYTIPIKGEFTLPMGAAAKPFAFQMLGDVPTMWALVDPNEDICMRKFRLVITEQPDAPSLSEYVGTIQMGQFVWHLFTND